MTAPNRTAAGLLAALCVCLPQVAAQEAEAPRRTTIPRDKFRDAFSKYRDVEALSEKAGAKAVAATPNADVGATMDTVFVASEAPTKPLQLEASARLALPMRVGVPLGAEAGSALALVEPFVTCVSAFVRKDAGFQAELVVGLVSASPGGAAERVVLDARFSVLVTGGDSDPKDFTLRRVGETQRVLLSVPAPRESVAIAIVAVIRQKSIPFDLKVPVQRPVVHVNVSPDSILGYGLGTATVLVQGDETTQPGESVVLKTTTGTLDPMVVVLDGSRVATTTLRSTGTGKATISLAGSEHTPEGSATITFTTPWVFLVWALLGGLLGTALRVYGKKHKGKVQKASHGGLRLLWTGVGLGFLGAVLWALGMQVLPWDWSPEWSEAAAFAMSGLVGYLGSLRFPGSPTKA